MNFKNNEPIKIAVAYNNGDIMEDFGEIEQLKIFDTQAGKIQKEEVVTVEGDDVASFYAFFPENNIDVLICNALTDEEGKALHHAGVLIYAGNRGSADEIVDRLLQQELFYDPGAYLSDNPACERCVDHRDYRMEIASEIGRISGHNRFHRGHNRVHGESTGHNQYAAHHNERHH